MPQSSTPSTKNATTPTTEPSNTAFFYGTLMAPQVLHRVCHGSMSSDNPIYATHNLKVTPALLTGYRRHRVRFADYPAIIPRADASVRGTLVTGLTDMDVYRLDIFEGDEYERRKVAVKALGKAGEVQGHAVEAQTYVWIAGEERLEDAEWDFEHFTRAKLSRWAGSEGEVEYAEVDEAVAEMDGTGGRGVGGVIGGRLEEEMRLGEQDVLGNAV